MLSTDFTMRDRGRPEVLTLSSRLRNDIDTAVFNGRLRGNCITRWSTSKQIAKKSGKHESLTLGSTFRSVKGRCKIYLNADTILMHPSPRTEMRQTLMVPK